MRKRIAALLLAGALGGGAAVMVSACGEDRGSVEQEGGTGTGGTGTSKTGTAPKTDPAERTTTSG